MHLLPLALVLTPFLPQITAWGTLGHRTVAYLSSLYFTPQSTHLTNTLLHGQDISEAALFPDKIRYIPSFAYTRGWHYIDAQDNPPHQCGINMTRDCAIASGGCVVSAIANHTSRLADQSLPLWQRGQSLRFVLHFLGDVHQPLHTEHEDRGGNEYTVAFDGKTTNLHSVWDTLIVNKHAGLGHDDEELAAWLWAQKLYARDEHDEDAKSLEDECLDDAAECALEWAGEANAHVCSYVLAHDVHGKDLAGEYYEGAVPIIDDMVRKAGRRLAAWINAIAEDTNLKGLEYLEPDLGIQTQ